MLHSKKITRILFDLSVLNIAFAAGIYFIDPHFLLSANSYTLLLVISNLIWLSSVAANRLYSYFEYIRFKQEIINVLGTYGLHLFIFLLIFLLFFSEEHGWRYFLYSYPLFLVLIVCGRYLLYFTLPNLRNIETLSYINIGYSNALEYIEQSIKDAHLGKVKYLGSFGCNLPKKYQKIGGFRDVLDYLKEHRVHLILHASSADLSAGEVRQLINYSKLNFIDFKIIPAEVNLLSSGIKMEMHNGFPLLSVKDEKIARIRYRLLKRSFDIGFSLLVILFILSWLCPIIALLIKLESPGPVFFAQKRVGYRNKPFTCLKFRSMQYDKEARFLQAVKGDVRVTRLGALLRKSSIDELPQFFNVLWNDMSVVGPRPHPVALDEGLQTELEHYILRHYTKPGITGWAQVNGWRGPTHTLEQKIERAGHDIWYLRNWSFWLDVRIILMTVFGSKTNKNAF